jgi:hypothetical protein
LTIIIVKFDESHQHNTARLPALVSLKVLRDGLLSPCDVVASIEGTRMDVRNERRDYQRSSQSCAIKKRIVLNALYWQWKLQWSKEPNAKKKATFVNNFAIFKIQRRQPKAMSEGPASSNVSG